MADGDWPFKVLIVIELELIYLLSCVIQKGLDLVLPQCLVVLVSGHGPGLLEPFETSRKNSGVETMLAHEQAILKSFKIGLYSFSKNTAVIKITPFGVETTLMKAQKTSFCSRYFFVFNNFNSENLSY